MRISAAIALSVACFFIGVFQGIWLNTVIGLAAIALVFIVCIVASNDN